MRGVALSLALLFNSPAGAEEAIPSSIKARVTELGVLFETASGQTLYTYDKDANPDQSTCVGQCAEAWPPFLAEGSEQPVGRWRFAQRSDGARQWSLDGKPVYRYVRDTAPGMVLGGGVQDIWHVAVSLAPRPKAVVYQGTIIGRVAANANKLTLYVSDQACLGKCLQQWQPLPAPWTANPVGEWSVVTRSDDATKQWAYRKAPVYTFKGDLLPGDLKGLQQAGGWRAVVLQPTAPLPDWVRLQISDYGPIFAGSLGMTLYSINTDMNELKRLYCDDTCMAASWTPVLANAGAMPHGNWTIAATASGQQWHYRGEPVFTYKSDRAPGDINGDRFAVGNGFGGFHVLLQKSLIEEAL